MFDPNRNVDSSIAEQHNDNRCYLIFIFWLVIAVLLS